MTKDSPSIVCRGLPSLVPAKDGRTRVPPELWERHQREIRQLYLDEDKPLPEVMEIMRQKGLVATKKMFKIRLERWNYVKNNRKDDVKLMLKLKRERDAMGKETTFLRNGKEVNLERYLKRANSTRLAEVLKKPVDQMDSLPEYLRVRSRSPTPELLACQYDLSSQEIVIWQMQKLASCHFESVRGNDLLANYEITGNLEYVNLLVVGSHYLKLGHQWEGWDLVRRAFNMLPALFTDEEPFSALMELFMYIVDYGDQATTTELWRFLAAYSKIVLGGAHPINEILQQIYSLYSTQPPEVLKGTVRNITIQIVRILKSNMESDPRLLRFMCWAHSYLELDSGWKAIKESILERANLAVAAAEKDHGKLSPQYASMSAILVNIKLSHHGLNSKEAFDYANQTAQEMEQLGCRSGLVYAMCRTWVALYHRHRWLESGEPALGHPRHELARHNLELGLGSQEVHKVGVEYSAEVMQLSMELANWYREVGLEQSARAMEKRRDDIFLALSTSRQAV